MYGAKSYIRTGLQKTNQLLSNNYMKKWPIFEVHKKKLYYNEERLIDVWSGPTKNF